MRQLVVGAMGVPLPRLLHFYYVCAVVAEDGRSGGGGDPGRHVEDAEALEGEGFLHGRVVSRGQLSQGCQPSLPAGARQNRSGQRVTKIRAAARKMLATRLLIA